MSGESVALVFPGQGSQRNGMLAEVPETEDLDRLIDAAEALSGMELRALDLLGGEEELADTRVAQPLLYLTDWAWATAVRDVGVTPLAVAGHSLGELAALAFAGVFSVEAGLELVVERSRLMASAAASQPGAMTAVVGLDASVIASIVDDIDGVWIANDNCTGQVVVSGRAPAVGQVEEMLASAGARRVVRLDVAGAFHSPLMEDAAAAFAHVVEGADFSDASIPVVQNAEPSQSTDASVIKARLVEQMAAPVRWTETMEALRDLGATRLVEVGPGKVLAGLARRCAGVEGVALDEAGMAALVGE
jgi:[acyl-carrier-protein] S-malonyltransferase